jgi:hypothetical protein
LVCFVGRKDSVGGCRLFRLSGSFGFSGLFGCIRVFFSSSGHCGLSGLFSLSGLFGFTCLSDLFGWSGFQPKKLNKRYLRFWFLSRYVIKPDIILDVFSPVKYIPSEYFHASTLM